MKTIFTILSLVLFSQLVYSADSLSSYQLNAHQIDSIFTERVKDQFNIRFDVYRAYEYSDAAGVHIILMTENQYHHSNDAWRKEKSDEFHDTIEAFCFSVLESGLKLEWSFWDYIIENECSQEYSISFWTKYFDLQDIDKDGYIDPIMIYGSFGMNGTHDGRIRIITYHHGKKRAIRHQNGSLDFERNTKVDSMFYTLPKPIQNEVRNRMVTIVSNDHAIFPYGWEDAMDKSKTYFDEN